MPIVKVQRRMMELGRVRLGEKGPKGEPRKLDRFRFTSASRALLDAVAVKYGGTVTDWADAPDEGYYQVTTEAAALDIILPPVFSSEDGTPTTSYSQWYELWSGGGCQRRCDGVTEALSGKACLCDDEKRACKVTTRVSFMLPDLPGLGVWRLDSHGWNAAVELPGTLEVLVLAASEHRFIPAVLRVENRTKKVPGEGTRRFVVPVIDLPNVTVKQLASGDVPLALNAPATTPKRGTRPELPAAGADSFPADTSFPDAQPGFGRPPALPSENREGGPKADVSDDGRSTARPEGSVSASVPDEAPSPSEVISQPQRKRLYTIASAGEVPKEEVQRIMRELAGVDSSTELPRDRYDAVVEAVAAWEPQGTLGATA